VFLGGEIRVLVLIWDCSFGVIEEKKEEKQIRERERERVFETLWDWDVSG
jgi:hypothetical protein